MHASNPLPLPIVFWILRLFVLNNALDLPERVNLDDFNSEDFEPQFDEGIREDRSSELPISQTFQMTIPKLEELHRCFGGVGSMDDNRPMMQEDRHSSISPSLYEIPAYIFLAGHLRETDNALIIGFGSGVMIAYFWAELMVSVNTEAHIYAFENRDTKKAIARRNLDKNGTYMTGRFSKRVCFPLPVPNKRYTLETQDFFKDIYLGENEVGFPGGSIAAANGPYDTIYVGCSLEGFTNGLDIVLRLLHPVGGIVMPFEVFDHMQAMIYFSPRGNCRLLKFSKMVPCESKYINKDKDILPKYFSDMSHVCEFLQRYYQESIFPSRLGEIKKRRESCPDCRRTYEDHEEDVFKAMEIGVSMGGGAGSKSYAKELNIDRQWREEELEKRKEWEDKGHEEATKEEEFKAKKFNWNELDPNIPEEEFLRDWTNNREITLPRINKKGTYVDEWWSPPSGYDDEEESEKRTAQSSSPTPTIAIVSPFTGKQRYDYYDPPEDDEVFEWDNATTKNTWDEEEEKGGGGGTDELHDN
mmetsp:Transcript_25459/g.42638  ORF Transcript_25459/g.42638 Transcript_25459/m.42638 type:complete len:528 (-) Transcript_25459:1148-2731(-)